MWKWNVAMPRLNPSVDPVCSSPFRKCWNGCFFFPHTPSSLRRKLVNLDSCVSLSFCQLPKMFCTHYMREAKTWNNATITTNTLRGSKLTMCLPCAEKRNFHRLKKADGALFTDGNDPRVRDSQMEKEKASLNDSISGPPRLSKCPEKPRRKKDWPL